MRGADGMPPAGLLRAGGSCCPSPPLLTSPPSAARAGASEEEAKAVAEADKHREDTIKQVQKAIQVGG